MPLVKNFENIIQEIQWTCFSKDRQLYKNWTGINFKRFQQLKEKLQDGSLDPIILAKLNKLYNAIIIQDYTCANDIYNELVQDSWESVGRHGMLFLKSVLMFYNSDSSVVGAIR